MRWVDDLTACVRAQERLACIALAALAGCGNAIQSSVNTSLSLHLSSGNSALQSKLVAGLVSFTGGVGLMVVANAGLCVSRRGGDDACAAPARWWHCCGGVLGSSAMTLLLVATHPALP